MQGVPQRRVPRYGVPMGRGEFRAAAVVAAAMAMAAALVAWTYHLPLRDPDGASLPTWFRLPVIVASAVALDVAHPVGAAGAPRRAPPGGPPSARWSSSGGTATRSCSP